MTRTYPGAILALPIILSLLTSACSDDDPAAPPTDEPDAVAIIGPAGGTVSADQTAVLHVPAGAFARAVEVTQRWRLDAPDAPAGWVQVGPAVAWAAGADVADATFQVALDPEFDPLENPGGLAYRLSRIVRLDADGTWMPVPGGDGILTLAMAAPVDVLGTFAVHVADPQAVTDRPLGEILLSASHSLRSDGATWSSIVTFEATDGSTGEALDDAGGAVRWDDRPMDHYGGKFALFWDRLGFVPGASSTLTVPGGDEIPALDLEITFLDRVPVITAPLVDAAADPAVPLTIAWDGRSARLIWLIIYGDGPDGFEYVGQMTPDDGEFVVSPEVLARFDAGGDVTVFLQDVVATPLDDPAYAPGSHVLIQCSSDTRIRIAGG